MAAAVNSYEEIRNQRLEENRRKFQDLGISSISKKLSQLTASANKPQHRVSKPKSRNAGLDVEPRRSSRQRNPVQSYRDELDIGELPTLRRGRRSTSSSLGSYLARPLEEVRLATDEERTAALKAAEKLQENLQTENPCFIKSMVRSHVYSCFWLGLPTAFCDQHLSKTGSEVVLEDEDGNEYDAVYIGKRTGLSGGWRGFALEHKLDDGDALVFELTQLARFKIYIVKASSMSLNHSKSRMDKENSRNTVMTSKALEYNEKRSSKRGVKPEMDDSQPTPDSGLNQTLRRSKRGAVPAIDDSKPSPDLESNQKRRSKRGLTPKMDDSQPSTDMESNQKRFKRTVVHEKDDKQPSLGSESNQILRRSKRNRG